MTLWTDRPGVPARPDTQRAAALLSQVETSIGRDVVNHLLPPVLALGFLTGAGVLALLLGLLGLAGVCGLFALAAVEWTIRTFRRIFGGAR